MKQLSHKLLLLFACFVFSEATFAQAKENQKGVFIPEKQAKEDDYNNPESRFNHKYKAESENLVVFWDQSFGTDPTQYMDKTHYALMHKTNMYHAPQMMEYWSNKHGLEIIGKMWRDTKADEPYEQWSYQFCLSGTSPYETVLSSTK